MRGARLGAGSGAQQARPQQLVERGAHSEHDATAAARGQRAQQRAQVGAQGGERRAEGGGDVERGGGLVRVRVRG